MPQRKPHAGQRFTGQKDSYQIIYPIADGSMSSVWAAKDSAGRLMALKVGKASARRVTERLRERFRDGMTEGEIAAQFDHPSVVKTVDWGMKSGNEFMVMEKVQGFLLVELMAGRLKDHQENPIPLLLETARAVQHVHEKGYIHRDISPKNIFIDFQNRVKLFDFGLTVSIEKAAHMRGNRTGTLSYMAPEIIKRERSDQRTDIYSFGVFMYELLTLRRPYTGVATFDKIIVIINSEPPHPSKFWRAIPPDMEGIIMKAIARDPRDRFKDVAELIAALKDYAHANDLETEVPEISESSWRRDVWQHR